MTKFIRVRGSQVLGLVFAIGLVASDAAVAGPADHAAPATRPAAAAPSRADWRAALLKAKRPGKGCFHAAYPSLTWQTVACVAPPRRPYNVGHGIDFSATVPGTITTAIGSFDAVNGVTSETGAGNVADSFSLQLNSGFFQTAACSGAQVPGDCQGWQQFIYSNTGSAFIEYWLIHWGNVPCPMGWTFSTPSCYIDSPAVPVPPQTIVDLAQLSLIGTAGAGGAMDGLALSTTSEVYLTSGDPTLINLAPKWNYAEFNIFGDGGSSTAAFNPGSNLIVRTTINDGTQNAPSCLGEGITSETNNLNIVTPCCPYAGATPAIVFDESNNVGAASMCAGGTSIGDTHLTNVNGLYYDFQAAGDFLLAQTDPGFAVQTRQRSGAPTWPNATVNKAVALRLDHSRVAVCLAPNRLVIEGKTTALDSGKTLMLPGGDSVTRSADTYVFTRKSGENVRAEVNSTWIDVTVGLGHVPVALVHGLLGNANGNAGPDELAARDRTVLHNPVGFADLYHRYGDSWRVPPAQSLPAQLCGERAAETANPATTFYAADLAPRDRDRAQAVCRAAGVRDGILLEACTLDAAVLGDKAAARAFVRAAPPRAVIHPPPPRGR